MRFEWDERKNKANLAKHGVSFDLACLVFDDPLHVSRLDRREGGEERWQTLGLIGPVAVFLVVHTFAENDGTTVARIIRRERRPSTKGGIMKKAARKTPKLPPKLARELKALEVMPDADIDTSDIPEVTDWRGAEVGKFYRPVKKSVTVRLDLDVLTWFKSQGERYQTKLNKVLRDYMIAHRGAR